MISCNVLKTAVCLHLHHLSICKKDTKNAKFLSFFVFLNKCVFAYMPYNNKNNIQNGKCHIGQLSTTKKTLPANVMTYYQQYTTFLCLTSDIMDLISYTRFFQRIGQTFVSQLQKVSLIENLTIEV